MPKHYIFEAGAGCRPKPGRHGKTEYPNYLQLILSNRQEALQLMSNLSSQLLDEKRTDFNLLFAGTISENNE